MREFLMVVVVYSKYTTAPFTTNRLFKSEGLPTWDDIRQFQDNLIGELECLSASVIDFKELRVSADEN